MSNYMGYAIDMKKVNLAEAKQNLSRYIERVERGETIIICKRNMPVAEIRPLAAERKKPRPIGLGKGTITIHPTFFDPLDDELLDLFEGKGLPR